MIHVARHEARAIVRSRFLFFYQRKAFRISGDNCRKGHLVYIAPGSEDRGQGL